ncbi:MAG: bifunctional transaldolase/phosoglucose isomerase [Ignavibacteriaceae bacterium]
MASLLKLSALGQSIWFDYIERKLITSGDLDELIIKGVRGITSNPAIFEKAISGSNDYDTEINKYSVKGLSAHDVYEKLALKDIALAADKFKELYHSSGRSDGFVSIEVDPAYAHNALLTVREAVRLYFTLNRENVMIKVPATKEGIVAFTELIGMGINVNVTLIFGMENYIEVAKGYIAGLQKLVKIGGNPSRVASVASFFVSRVDTAVDKLLEAKGEKELMGKIAVANSKASYKAYKKLFSGRKWDELEKIGARKQRLLWASTGTKNPHYSETLYVDELIGLNTVNTIPPQTLNAYLKKGKVKNTLNKKIGEAEKQLARLKELNIDLVAVTEKLQYEGIKSFADSFDLLINTLDKKVRSFKYYGNINLNPSQYRSVADDLAKNLNVAQISDRLFKKDHTLWSASPVEIENRLGWLDSPVVMQEKLNEIYKFVEEIRKENFTHVLLLGMGGSSLAPEVFRNVFFSQPGYPDLNILDSTDPEMIQERLNNFPCYQDGINKIKTLYIVSTKSGGTVETFSLMKYVYRYVVNNGGVGNAGKHFVAITDPGSGLEKIAKEYAFRKIFLNDPNIGGRYSALSMFGLVPAALLGIDIKLLLKNAQDMLDICKEPAPDTGKVLQPLVLGSLIGKLAVAGRNKIILVFNDKLLPFGNWIEQLVAESSGKNGKGILPVVSYGYDNLHLFGKDTVVVNIKLSKDESEEKVKMSETGNTPLIEITLRSEYDLGSQFVLWEILTVMACKELGVQPFDQPDVESAKVSARKLLAEYKDTGKLPAMVSSYEKDGLKIVSDLKGGSRVEIESNFFREISHGKNYIALHAYMNMSPSNEKKLNRFRETLEQRYKVPVTIGYGPRFLHSTGQLHKGDNGDGYFIQILSTPAMDLQVPDEMNDDKSSISFALLRNAQALGDRNALLNNKRKVLTYIFDKEIKLT